MTPSTLHPNQNNRQLLSVVSLSDILLFPLFHSIVKAGKDTWGIDQSPSTQLHLCVETEIVTGKRNMTMETK